jgi:hypothetical protein
LFVTTKQTFPAMLDDVETFAEGIDRARSYIAENEAECADGEGSQQRVRPNG